VLSLENQIIKTVGPLFAELEVRVLEYTVPGGALNTDGTVTRVTKVLDQKSAMVTAAIPVGFGNSASPVTVVVSRYVSWEQREAELRQRIKEYETQSAPDPEYQAALLAPTPPQLPSNAPTSPPPSPSPLDYLSGNVNVNPKPHTDSPDSDL